jgi:hypothetical protein
LLGIARVNTLLHDAAAVFVTSYKAAVFHHFIKYELLVLAGPRSQQLEKHMVAIDFMRQHFHIGRKLISKGQTVGSEFFLSRGFN